MRGLSQLKKVADMAQREDRERMDDYLTSVSGANIILSPSERVQHTDMDQCSNNKRVCRRRHLYVSRDRASGDCPF